MSMQMHKNNKYSNIICGLLMIYWMIFLLPTESYFQVYLVVGVLGIVTFIETRRMGLSIDISRAEKKVLFGCDIVFSLAVAVANYNIFDNLTCLGSNNPKILLLYKIINALLVFGGGVILCHSILCYSALKLRNFFWNKVIHKTKAGTVFALVFTLISLIDLSMLFGAKWPGIVMPDTVTQLREILSGAYTDHHPILHTMLIRIWLNLGIRLFGDINVGILLYSIFQILFMASCFGYCIMTIYQMNVSRKLVALSVFFYALMPYHIMYSVTVWKDTMFGGFVLIFSVSAFRLLKNLGMRKYLNYILLIIGGMGVCLFRTNGLFAFGLTILLSLFLLLKKHKHIIYIMCLIFFVSLAFKHVVFPILNVAKADFALGFSIPMQQFARTIVDDRQSLNSEELEDLNKIMNVDAVPDVYDSGLYNPVTALVRENQDYLQANLAHYAGLWLRLGLKHPKAYICAWVDQTKGYWNGGYWKWRWLSKTYDNEFGIYMKTYSESYEKISTLLLHEVAGNSMLVILLCIGLHVWLCGWMAFCSFIRKDKETLFTIMPCLSMVVSLIIATPVYSEFRYAYSIFCCVPFMLISLFYNKERNKDLK